MGLLDLPAALFTWLDQFLGLLPPAIRLLLWAAVAALASMELYRLLSPQQRVAELKLALEGAQRGLAAYDGPFEGAWTLIRRMLGLALRRVIIVLPATLAASLPLLLLIIWLDTAYNRTFPPAGQAVAVKVAGDYNGQWVDPDGATPPRARVLSDNGGTVADVPVGAPISVLHKHQWWNALIGNPAGYLEDSAPFDRIEIDLPRQEFLSVGPAWLRGWETIFFPALILIALGFKVTRRIQ